MPWLHLARENCLPFLTLLAVFLQFPFVLGTGRYDLEHPEKRLIDMSTPIPIWLILVFGEPLKSIDESGRLLQKDVAGGGTRCRLRPSFPYQKGWN
jgi:hypothetical protein